MDRGGGGKTCADVGGALLSYPDSDARADINKGTAIMSHQSRKHDSARLRTHATGRAVIDDALAMAEARGDRKAVANLRMVQVQMIVQDNQFYIPSGDPSTLLGDDMAPSQFPTSSLIIPNPRGEV